MLINLLEAPLLAVILGYFTKYISGTDADPDAYIFAENVNIIAYLFMAVTVALFFGMTLSAEEIIKDQDLWNAIPLYQVLQPHPLHRDFMLHLFDTYAEILVIE